MILSDSKYLVLTGVIDQMRWLELCVLSKFYHIYFIHCSALLSTTKKKHYITLTLHYIALQIILSTGMRAFYQNCPPWCFLKALNS